MLDLSTLRNARFTVPGDPDWNPDADFSGDDAVNVVDLGIMRQYAFDAPGPKRAGQRVQLIGASEGRAMTDGVSGGGVRPPAASDGVGVTLEAIGPKQVSRWPPASRTVASCAY